MQHAGNSFWVLSLLIHLVSLFSSWLLLLQVGSSVFFALLILALENSAYLLSAYLLSCLLTSCPICLPLSSHAYLGFQSL